MCGVCGCGEAEGSKVAHEHGHEHEHEHVGPDGKPFRHSHHAEESGHLHDHLGAELSGVGISTARLITIQKDLLGKNDELAALNRARFAKAGTFVVNLMSSPGSGKTTLLTRTLEALKGKVELGVIEGDQQTTLDADRIRKTGVRAVQINTGKGCHLDAAMIARALEAMPPPKGILFVENVGNLVCPAGFDLGETRRVVVVSVTEGEDKPLKYPDMFARADVVLVNKVDLLPYVGDFDVSALEGNVRKLKPGVPTLRVSATKGTGFEAWLDWLSTGAKAANGA